ncbi:CAS-like protein [Mya arenaria]|uniref:CAS-like protein n=1 Tax=Mya arenaria TaxID=6604 RepID=A0ABY7EX28_MYAAR|nr:CAS-like protein [Mya arenaria]
MAHIYKRKLGKLDAICAKLKLNSSPDSPDEEKSLSNSIVNGEEKENTVDRIETAVASSNINNNIIGKEDLNNTETEIDNTQEDSNSQALDFTIKPKLNINIGDIGDENDSLDQRNDEKSTENEQPENTNQSSSSNRRKRKAAVPRSLTQVKDYYGHLDEKDELAEYEINNLNTNFPPEDYEDERNTSGSGRESLSRSVNDGKSSPQHLNHSKSSTVSSLSKESTRSRLSSEIDPSHTSAPLDLSLSSRQSRYDEDSAQGDLTSDDEKNGGFSDNEDDDFFNPDRNLVIDESRNRAIKQGNAPSMGFASFHGVSGENNTPLKDFAENTMNELISMYYGNFGGSGEPSKYLQQKNMKSLSQNQGLSLCENSLSSASKSSFQIPPMSSGDEESHDGFPPMKGIYANYVNSAGAPPKSGGNKLQNDRFTTSSSFINAVFVKKEEMVRHYKWHRKREESLQHGFLRFSPLDNCSKRFGNCTHNSKQTHYHCLQPGCDKVYISTSDVQMHANYHRKDSAIMSEGFQRFRATEDCGTPACSFYGQRTTHFHCLRSDCRFTFKNKADMGCDYVLHSTAQLYSHKRKHEKRDFESAYKKYQNHSTPQGPKPILPRPDLGNAAGSITNGTPVIQSVGAPGIKHKIDWDRSESIELKKPKIEINSDVDMSVTSSPSGRSTPADKFWPQTPADDSMDMDDLSNPEDSRDSSPPEKSRLAGMDAEAGINLSGSLTLPIPRFQTLTAKDSAPALPTSTTQSSTPTMSEQSQPKSEPDALFRPVTSENFHSTHRLSASPSLGGNLLSMNPGTLLTVPSTIQGASTVLQPPKSVYTERREKDDSWKTYLVRYTANDPCNPRCLYLYKDHYHCKIEGCLVLFKSKDGVREHARFHELQDRITPIAYQTFEIEDACPEQCQYSEKEKHFHCIWTGCSHVVPYVGPTFGRLEHYRIHEYARAAAGKSYNRGAGVGKPGQVVEDNTMRRRGRPPKYPKIELPKIPKVELSDEEIRLSQMSQISDRPGNAKVINGFRIFSPEDPCPDERCSFIGNLHYHCARPRCFTITDRIDVLNLHAKDFHSFVQILEGYEFFDRSVSCRRFHCPNNQTNRHFHCTRPKCDYSFIRHSTMAQHEKKHQSSNSASPTSDSPLSPNLFHMNIPATIGGAITSSQQLPLSAIMPVSVIPSASQPNIPVFLSQQGNHTLALSQGSVIVQNTSAASLRGSTVTMATGTNSVSSIQALPASSIAGTQITGMGGQLNLQNLDGSIIRNANVLLNVLLKQGGINQLPQPSWNELRAKMHYSLTMNCGRPFCKLKKKDHYHCLDCNQAFSDPARLRSHVGKHGVKLKKNDQIENTPIAPKPVNLSIQSIPKPQPVISNTVTSLNMDPDEAQCLAGNIAGNDSDDSDEDVKSSSLNLNPSTFSEMIFKAQEQNQIGSDMDSGSDLDDDTGENNLRIDTGSEVDAQSDSNDHQADISSRSGRKIIKTKHEGFMNSGDINLSKQWPVSSSKSTGKAIKSPQANGTNAASKIVTTGTRGARDDSVPAGYSRWRYNEECRYPKCAYKHNVTHFHCVREDCGYGFSDRSRLVQHTLRHERIDSITGGELQQFRINQDCEVPDCEYKLKMSHFHCKRCTYCCTDSSKVLTHRKNHAKIDKIESQGFTKCLAADDCGMSLCPYARKQTHFHCLIEACQAPVLGPAQMSAHKIKHDTDNSTMSTDA